MKIIQLTNKTPCQSMGYVIVAKTGEVLVIDSGASGNGDELYRVIKKVGGKVDLWLITHPHRDHHDALIEMLTEHKDIEYKRIGSSFLPDAWAGDHINREELYKWNAFAPSLGEKLFEIKEKTTFIFGSMEIEILAGSNPDIEENKFNNQSCVFKISEDDFSLLILGDLGIEGGQRLLQKAKGKLKCTAVQMAHHGQQGVAEDLYIEIAPKFAFWPTPLWLWENRRYLGRGEIGEGSFETPKNAEWMKKLEAENIFSFEHTTVFDTKDYTVAEF